MSTGHKEAGTANVIIATKQKNRGEAAAGDVQTLTDSRQELIKITGGGVAAPSQVQQVPGGAHDMALRTPRFTWSPHALCRDDFNMT